MYFIYYRVRVILMKLNWAPDFSGRLIIYQYVYNLCINRKTYYFAHKMYNINFEATFDT